MAISETLLDALGNLFHARVYKKKTNFSAELNFDKYANLSLSAGQLEEKEKIKIEKEKKKYFDQLEEKYNDILKKDEIRRLKKLSVEQQRDIFLENELNKHKNCKIELTIKDEYSNKSISIFCCFSETIELIKHKIKKKQEN